MWQTKGLRHYRLDGFIMTYIVVKRFDYFMNVSAGWCDRFTDEHLHHLSYTADI